MLSGNTGRRGARVVGLVVQEAALGVESVGHPRKPVGFPGKLSRHRSRPGPCTAKLTSSTCPGFSKVRRLGLG